MCRCSSLFFVIFFVIFISFVLKLSGYVLDPIQAEKCRIKCSLLNLTSRADDMMCLRRCLTYDLKPGKCPTDMNSTVPHFEELCPNLCRGDTECTGVKKCCQHECGGTICLAPTQLEIAIGVPPKPTELAIHVNKSDFDEHGIPIKISWTCPTTVNQQPVQFLIEERTNENLTHFEYESEDWVVAKRTPHKNVSIRSFFTPGLYYQFRVHAINQNGTAGPSDPCQPFQIISRITEIAPGPPQGFHIGAQSWGNGSLRYLLQWKPPATSMPIYKYKVTWSILTNEKLQQKSRYFSADMDRFWLNHIRPKTEYFFDLNAMVRFEEKKVLGTAARLVVESHERPPPKKRRKIHPSELNLKYKDFIRNIRVDKLFWIQNNLFADIVWDAIGDNTSIDYSLNWTPHSACKHYNQAWYVGSVNVPIFELYDIIPGCSYFVSVKAIFKDILYTTNISIPFDECVHKRRQHKKKIYSDIPDVIRHFENRPIHVQNCSLTASRKPT